MSLDFDYDANIDVDVDNSISFDADVDFDSDFDLNVDLDTNFELDDGNMAVLTIDANAIGDDFGDDTLVEINSSVLATDNTSSISLSVVALVDDDGFL